MSSQAKIVEDGLVRQVHLLRPIHWYLRWDVLPFFIAYTLLFIILLTANIFRRQYSVINVTIVQEVNGHNSDSDLSSLRVRVALIALPILLSGQVLLFLLSQWSMRLKTRLGFRPCTSVQAATHAHVVAAKHAGQDRIVPLQFQPPTELLLPGSSLALREHRVQIAGSKYGMSELRFDFQKVVYEFDQDRNTFIRMQYPVSGPIKSFLAYRGLGDEKDGAVATGKWGLNFFDIPLPAFLDLYIEHLTAPFFVFQVLCLFLWSLDDYWYYSAFTLLMLLFFEGVMCQRRLSSLQVLRNMRRPSVPVQCYRGGAWRICPSEMLVPGDVIALTTTQLLPNNPNGATSSARDDLVVPVDAVLVRGSCVVKEAMLTGESVPQVKEALSTCEADGDSGLLDLSSGKSESEVRRHVVYSGTTLLQDSAAAADEAAASHGTGEALPLPPRGGCTAVVVRTAFGTTQGGLMQKILFAAENMSEGNSETGAFIAVLVVCALLASAIVLHAGLQDASRNRFRLVLHCVMIVTSVVPPELPMELSLAVMNNLNVLAQNLIYCTEPFRLPLAGKLDVLCFDKTGTLTQDRMQLRGVVAAQAVDVLPAARRDSAADKDVTAEPIEQESLPLEICSFEAAPEDDGGASGHGAQEVPLNVLAIMAACNSLFCTADGSMQGDPLETVTMQASGFSPSPKAAGAASSGLGGLGELTHAGRQATVTRRQLYPFSSALRRMSVVAAVAPMRSSPASVDAASKSAPQVPALWVFTKGAPEALAGLLTTVPRNYHDVYQHHMSAGKRVLAIACRKLPKSLTSQSIRDLPRAQAEAGLSFCGFLVYDCDLKADSRGVIRELRQSLHEVIMITGDSAHTAADVARRLGMLRGDVPLLLLHALPSGALVWRAAYSGGPTDEAFQTGGIVELSAKCDLCVAGDALQALLAATAAAEGVLEVLSPHVKIFARVSPAQKEAVLRALNSSGRTTLMCGDGTNDVGALKAAHVGVSIVNNPEFERQVDATLSGRTGKSSGGTTKDRMERALAELQKQESDPTIVKLGDASVASPFTARRTSVDSVLTVLRQGRCTLVTTIQMFKILALNCLMSAYTMSALYLRGLKSGDVQMTASGLMTAALFFGLSLAKPTHIIAPAKPPSSIFAAAPALSVTGQFIVHMCCLACALRLCDPYIQAIEGTKGADGKFFPNLINSTVFLLTTAILINNFVVNYRGEPHTLGIRANRVMWRSVQAAYAVLAVAAGGQLEPLNDLLQLATWPDAQFQAQLLGLLVADLGGAYAVEQACRRLE